MADEHRAPKITFPGSYVKDGRLIMANGLVAFEPIPEGDIRNDWLGDWPIPGEGEEALTAPVLLHYAEDRLASIRSGRRELSLRVVPAYAAPLRDELMAMAKETTANLALAFGRRGDGLSHEWLTAPTDLDCACLNLARAVEWLTANPSGNPPGEQAELAPGEPVGRVQAVAARYRAGGEPDGPVMCVKFIKEVFDIDDTSVGRNVTDRMDMPKGTYDGRRAPKAYSWEGFCKWCSGRRRAFDAEQVYHDWKLKVPEQKFTSWQNYRPGNSA